MKTVQFEIKKLGAIRNSIIEIKPLMLFSGESGLGKSYAAFLVHYFYILLSGHRLVKFFEDNHYDYNGILQNKKNKEVLLRVSVADLIEWINKDAITYIGYLIGHNNFTGEVNFSFEYNQAYFDFFYEEELGGLDNQEEVYYKITLNNFSYRLISSSFNLDAIPFTELIKAVLTKEIFLSYPAIKQTCLLPPSRGALMELNERPSFMSGMYDEFFDLKAALNRPLSAPVISDPTITECMAEVNHGKLQQVEGRLIYYTKDGVSMPLTAAASSIKELAPFSLLLNKYSADGLSILFEEPEAHLHPNRQIRIADLIASAVNKGSHLQITTHSDYLIKRINILIKLFLLKSKNKEDEVNQILERWGIQEDCLLDPNNIGAYVLKEENGYTKIEQQNIFSNNEISFESFYDVIEKDILLSRQIMNLTTKN